jgi:hypothetical protein
MTGNPVRHVRRLAYTAAAILQLGLAHAADAPVAAAPKPEDFPKLEYVYAATVGIGPIEKVGDTVQGVQRIIPITGGTFEGPAIRGTVFAGGGDWNLARSDGSTAVEAYYFLRTDDGVVIKIVNRGVIPKPKGAGAPARPPFTTPVFEAPKGKYEWLNDGVYVGTITPKPGGGAVIIRVFKVV